MRSRAAILHDVGGPCIARLARLYQTGQLQLDEMITKRYRLDDINDAYDDLLNGKLIRGVIDFALS
jgi:Zn-dependent alcohol dehydrogenase